MKPEDGESLQGEIARRVAIEFGLDTGRSPTLTQTINNGALFANVRGERVLFDSRALVLGMLAAGKANADQIQFGNAAFWLRQWLSEQIGQEGLSRVLDEELVIIVGQPTRVLDVTLSASVTDLIDRAGSIARRTKGSDAFEARHLLAAMIVKGTVANQAQKSFGLVVGAEADERLKRWLVDRFLERPGENETLARWLAVFDLPHTPGEARRSSFRVNEGILPFRNDHVGRVHPADAAGAGVSVDLLKTADDVKSLADLLCLKEATPLALAIFGGWGSGKSSFMQALDQRIRALCDRWQERVERGEDSPFVTRIVHIRFNAWQFVDANLWASLTAEFFDQLRAGGWNKAGEVRHAGLVDRVNRHVHSLTADAAERRDAAARGGQEVQRAQKARDEAAVEARSDGKRLSYAAMAKLGEIYEREKRNLSALGLPTGGAEAARSVETVVEVVRNSKSAFSQFQAVFGVLRKSRTRLWVAGVAAVVVAAAAVMLVAGIVQTEQVTRIAVTLFAAVAAAGTAAAAIAPAVRMVLSVARNAGDIARVVAAADEGAVARVLEAEIALNDATLEADALSEEARRAERTLARYVDPDRATNPPRLLRYVLEDDPDTRSFERELGLIGRARRLFQAVDDIVSKAASDEDVPERIVLYVDDLDRCTEEQVYNVLQAIHLLLAFPSFAVVVGVDVKWIENALAREFTAERAPALSEVERRQHAVHYLEKIFQVVFWLDPLTPGQDGESGTFAEFVRNLAQPTTTTEPEDGHDHERDRSDERPKEVGPAAGKGESVQGEAPPAQPAPDGAARDKVEEAESPGGGDEAAPSREEALRPIELDRDEIDFLATDEIAAVAGCTPRAATHLINVYRLVRSRLARSGGDIAADYPLIALCVAVETGQPVEIADSFLDVVKYLAGKDEQVAVLSGSELKGSITSQFETAMAAHLNAALGTPVDAPLVKWSDRSPGLGPALGRIAEVRDEALTARDLFRIARLARRYSFNRYR